jgi:hypothetical protein
VEHRPHKGPVVDGTAVLRPSTPAPCPPLLPHGTWWHQRDLVVRVVSSSSLSRVWPGPYCVTGALWFAESAACRRRRLTTERRARHRHPPLAPLAPHQSLPARDAAHALKRGGVVSGPRRVQEGARAAERDSAGGGSSILELISLDRFVTYVQVSPRPGPHHMRSARCVGSFSARIASRAFSRRIVSSGVTVPQGWPIWCAPDAMRPDAGLRHPGEPDGRPAETTPELARETGPETGVRRCSDEDASPG